LLRQTALIDKSSLSDEEKNLKRSELYNNIETLNLLKEIFTNEDLKKTGIFADDAYTSVLKNYSDMKTSISLETSLDKKAIGTDVYWGL